MTRDGADVIIVGAGPAGAATALLLARAGVDVLMLDRAAFPRPKPCGDCLSIGATSILERLGVLEDVLAAPHARLRGWRIIAPSGDSFRADFDDGSPRARGHDARAERGLSGSALAIERSAFDALLVRAAMAAGARLERAQVTGVIRDSGGIVTGVQTRSGERAALLTVGADGLRSIVASRLGARRTPGPLRKLSLTFHVPVRGADNTGEMHVGSGTCAGIAPVDADGRCNVTVVAETARFARQVAANPAAFAHAAIETLPRLRGRVSAASLHSATPLASGPFDRPVHSIAFPGAVLVGDAAGYYDPFTGQGVFQALASAERLAPVIIDAIARRDVRAGSFAPYVDARRALVRGARFVQIGIDHVLRRPALADRAIRHISRAPAFAHAIISVTGDIAPVRALASPRALTSILAPAHLPENAA